MIPRFDEPVRRRIRYQERQGIYAIVPRGGLMLLTHQSEPVPEFQLPGGGVDPGEFPLAALIRETLEETGWKVRIERRIGAYRRFTHMPEYGTWARKTCRIYLATPVLHVGPPLEDIHTAIWASPADAVELLDAQGDREMMKRYLLTL